MTSEVDDSVWRITIATVLTGGLMGVVGGLFLKTLILLVMETRGLSRPALSMIAAVIGAVAMARLIRTPFLSHGLEGTMKTAVNHDPTSVGPGR